MPAAVAAAVAAAALEAQLQRLVRGFPGPLCAAFGYGSGVLPQTGGGGRGPPKMLDVVLVVEDDAAAWHAANLRHHPTHYTGAMRCLGASRLARLQAAGPVQLFFNTRVPFEDRLVKYGVTTRAALTEDLCSWRALYLAGRLHKPVRWLLPTQDVELDAALRVNLRAAAAAALLLCAERHVSQVEFLRAVTRLSYDGDPRMGLAEDAFKVDNIVLGQQTQLRRLYAPVLADLSCVVLDEDKDSLHWKDDNTESQLWACLPPDVLRRAGLAHHNRSVDGLRSELRRTVSRASSVQTLKSFLTAGFIKGIQYGSSKVFKNVHSLIKKR